MLRRALLVNREKGGTLALLLLLMACVDRAQPEWRYPVHLGISRDSAHSLLGLADPTRPAERKHVEWFPSSGISLNYDTTDHVREINFKGNWGEKDWIPSRSAIAFGITPQTPYSELVQRLGSPIRTDSTWLSEGYLEHTWRRGGIRLTADVWARDYSDGSALHKQGTTRLLTASPAVE